MNIKGMRVVNLSAETCGCLVPHVWNAGPEHGDRSSQLNERTHMSIRQTQKLFCLDKICHRALTKTPADSRVVDGEEALEDRRLFSSCVYPGVSLNDVPQLSTYPSLGARTPNPATPVRTLE